MKLKTAIEILDISNDHNPNYTDAERREAHQLGIEALKFISVSRPDPHFGHIPELPGETKE